MNKIKGKNKEHEITLKQSEVSDKKVVVVNQTKREILLPPSLFVCNTLTKSVSTFCQMMHTNSDIGSIFFFNDVLCSSRSSTQSY